MLQIIFWLMLIIWTDRLISGKSEDKKLPIIVQAISIHVILLDFIRKSSTLRKYLIH